MIWFTADTHFNHEKIISYIKRPFKTVEEMNEKLIENWNKKVGKRDLVYHLGDFGFGNPDPILERLNGFKKLVIGSHDRDAVKSKLWSQKEMIVEIRELNIPIILCHYCMRVWPKSHFNSFHCFGHSHGFLKPSGKSWDVGVDCNNYTPVSFLELLEIMKNRPDNFNLVKDMREAHIEKVDDDFQSGEEIRRNYTF